MNVLEQIIHAIEHSIDAGTSHALPWSAEAETVLGVVSDDSFSTSNDDWIYTGVVDGARWTIRLEVQQWP